MQRFCLAGWSPFLLLAGIFYNIAAGAQPAEAYLDRNEIYQGETVLLTIEVAGQVVGDSPDAGLLTQDFQILDSQRSSQVEMIDGRHITKDQWTFELEPNKTGQLTIPAMSIGTRLRTPALTLNVLSLTPGTAQNDDADDIFIEVSAQPLNPYVQSQVRYSERLFYAVALRDGSLNRIDPPSDDLIMERIGEELTYVDQRNGRNYRVIERKFAIFPQKSGEVSIPVVVFRGRISQQSTTGSQRDRFVTRGKQVRVESDRLVLKVQPQPAAFTGQRWLPSAELTLQETWSQDPPQFRVGEPVTRTLILQARGLDATQLPELSIPDITAASIYPDQPVSETRQDGSWLVGRVEQRLAIVPTQPGEITLPEIRLPWWDTESDRERIALIPARTITVSPGDTASDKDSALPPPDPQPAPAAEVQPIKPPAAAPMIDNNGFWPWLSMGLAILWLLTLLGWQRERQRNQVRVDSSVSVSMTDGKAVRQVLRRACQRNDPQAAAQALLDWAETFRPQQPPTNLAELAALVSNDEAPLRALDRALYAPTTGDWRGDSLWRAVKNGLKLKSLPEQQLDRTMLPPLYPQQI